MSVKDMSIWFGHAINKELREPSVDGQLGEITRVNNGTRTVLLHQCMEKSLSVSLHWIKQGESSSRERCIELQLFEDIVANKGPRRI